MKKFEFDSFWFAIATIWFSTGVAVSLAIWVTKSASPLWGMLIPAFMEYSRTTSKGSSTGSSPVTKSKEELK